MPIDADVMKKNPVALRVPAVMMLVAAMVLTVTLLWTRPAPLLAAPGIAPAPEAEFTAKIRPFLAEYCFDCHGEDKQKADRRFDRLTMPITDARTLIELQDMLDILNLGEMPPKKADQPNKAERRQVIDWLTHTIKQRYELLRSTDQQTALRRLNRREYRNTIRDLFKMDVTIFDPTRAFPRDEMVEHLDTLGGELVTSGYLMDRYLEAADEIVEKVFAMPAQPRVQTWHFTDNFRQQDELDGSLKDWANFEFIALYETPISQRHEGAYAKIHGFEAGVPHDGHYEIRALAVAKHREHDHPRNRVSTDPDQPLRLAIVPGKESFGDLSRPQPIEPQLAEFTLKDDEQKWYEATVWLDAGFTPRFTFPNGMLHLRSNFGPIANQVAKQLKAEGKKVGNDFGDRRLMAMKYGKLPHIQIHEVEIRGPIYDAWPTPAQQTLLGGEPFSPDRMRELLTSFVSRAYRRPARPAEIDALMAFVDSRIQAGAEPFGAYKDALKRVLCSPGFLYLDEPADDKGRLTDHALASRLSYLLWSSMPDEELLKLAAQGRLSEPDVLKAQLRRMIDDPKSEVFIESFLDSWLTLRDLGSQPPDRRAFDVYWARNLKEAMLTETRMFARHVLDENLPIMTFIDADFTFVNGPLADLYGIEGVSGPQFRKVKLEDPRRGGVLGQASVLTVTANGIDTSPVTRGVWVLANLLGTPPSPPPPDVKPLDPDTRGATSIRHQFEKHRENPACYDCHREIDPIGFALESFDPIGEWRDTYGRNVPIDTAGELPDGTSFKDVTGLKQALLDRRDQVARSLTSKLLSYATGRHMEPADRPAIDGIVDDLHDRGDGFYDLLELIVLSDVFNSP